MARFIALPVGQGDAFYLGTPRGSVLVDGGRSRTAFSGLFREFTRRNGADVVIVTHNDADHANGIIGFLEGGLWCREIWLPGRWLHLLPQVLRPMREILPLLVRQAEDAEREIGSVDECAEDTLLERYAAPHALAEGPTEIEWDVAEGGELDESGWPVELISELEQAAAEDEWWIFEYPRIPIAVILGEIVPWWEIIPKKVARMLIEALCAAKRIRTIALEAFHRGIAVRWFEHDPRNPSGGVPWLKPMSCRQIARLRPAPEETLLMLLALSAENRESLVFLHPSTVSAPGVLFTADSDLKDVRLPRLERAIVTAPHHGSEANRAAYRRVANSAETSSMVWVRSDGRFRSRPCKEYIKRPERKSCTLCRGSRAPKQAVIFHSHTCRWVRNKGVRTCNCH